MSLRIVPASGHATSTHQAGLYTGAPSAPGVHDTLRSNLSLTTPAPTSTAQQPASASTHAPLQSSHPLEARLTAWRATQEQLKMSLLGRQFGIAEPVRRGMEMQIVRAGEWTPASAGLGREGGGVASDILRGRDAEIGWEDVFTAGAELRNVPDFHTEMEGRMRMNW